MLGLSLKPSVSAGASSKFDRFYSLQCVNNRSPGVGTEKSYSFTETMRRMLAVKRIN